MTIPATIGAPVSLVVVLEDGNTSMFPQAEIYEAGSSTPILVVDLDHTAKGKYESSWTPADVGTYSALFIVYSDVGHTIESILYTREVEQVFVTQTDIDSLAAAVTRILGLVHENAFIDNTVFDSHGQLLSARIRIFDSKEHTLAATDGGSETTGLIATYDITAEYETVGKMKQYRVVKL